MEAGIADHVWSIEEIVGLLDRNEMMVGLLMMIEVLALILLARYRGVGRDWWPRGGPFSN
jgi:hypothetical protein